MLNPPGSTCKVLQNVMKPFARDEDLHNVVLVFILGNLRLNGDTDKVYAHNFRALHIEGNQVAALFPTLAGDCDVSTVGSRMTGCDIHQVFPCA